MIRGIYDPEKLFDKYSILPKLSPKQIAHLFVGKDRLYADVILYARYMKSSKLHYDYCMFKIIQPFGNDFYICADTLLGNCWESIKLTGLLDDYHEEITEFVSDYIRKYIKRSGILKLEVDIEAFLDETNGNEYSVVYEDFDSFKDDDSLKNKIRYDNFEEYDSDLDDKWSKKYDGFEDSLDIDNIIEEDFDD